MNARGNSSISSGGNTRARTRSGVGIAAIAAALIWATVFAGAAHAAPGTNKKTFTSNSAVAVPDATSEGPGHTAAPVSVSGLTGDITSVTASFHLTHERISDLDIGVFGPDLTTFAWLINRPPVSGDSFGSSCADADRTVFDDGAATLIESGTPPYSGIYRPFSAYGEFPLGVFSGLGPAGSNGTWTLEVYDSEAGGSGTVECWSLMIETTTGQSLRFDSDGPMAIADAFGGPGTASSPISVSGISGALSSATVAVWITHPNVSDLDLVLVAPTGQEVALAQGVGGSGDDFGGTCSSSKMTVFNDSAKQSILQSTAPFIGTFKPSTPLSLLVGLEGEALNGEWSLRATDKVEGNVGTINCWSLTVQSSATKGPGLSVTPRLLPPSPLPGTFVYSYFDIKNPGATSISNVVLTATMPKEVTDLRADPLNFPECQVQGGTLTCTYAQIGPNGSLRGGALAKVGKPKSGKFCITGTVSGEGAGPVSTKACFNTLAYPAGDRGTGYGVGDIAHDFTLLDQTGTPVSLSNFAGKYVLLQFTSAWCAPSVFEVPQDRDEIRALNESGAMGVEVVYLTVMLDGQTPNVPSTQIDAQVWVNQFGLGTPVLFTSNDATKVAVQHNTSYSTVAGQSGPVVPVSVFIKPNQQIFSVRVGLHEPGDTTERFLNALP